MRLQLVRSTIVRVLLALGLFAVTVVADVSGVY